MGWGRPRGGAAPRRSRGADWPEAESLENRDPRPPGALAAWHSPQPGCRLSPACAKMGERLRGGGRGREEGGARNDANGQTGVPGRAGLWGLGRGGPGGLSWGPGGRECPRGPQSAHL